MVFCPAPSARFRPTAERSRPITLMSELWIAACPVADLSPDDVIRFDQGERTFAIYRPADDKFYATDGRCTHAKVHLA